MPGKWAIVIVLLAAGCARPKYVEGESGGSSGAPAPQAQADCSLRFRVSGFCLSWFWENKPTPTQAGSLIFKVFRENLFDRTPVAVDLPSASLMLWMPGMNHGSSPTRTERLDVGTYRASAVFFIMPGEWDLHFQAKEGAAVQDEAVVSLVF